AAATPPRWRACWVTRTACWGAHEAGALRGLARAGVGWPAGLAGRARPPAEARHAQRAGAGFPGGLPARLPSPRAGARARLQPRSHRAAAAAGAARPPRAVPPAAAALAPRGRVPGRRLPAPGARAVALHGAGGGVVLRAGAAVAGLAAGASGVRAHAVQQRAA